MVYVEYDGDTGIANIAKYQDRGPQNEVYLTNGNYIGFVLEGYTGTEKVMISAKAVAGDPVLGYLDATAEGAEIPSGTNMKMTEMYYDVTAYVRPYDSTKYVLVLGNIADAAAETRSILSVSGIKLANHIIPATSTQIAADIASLVTLAYQPVEEPVFTPERFELRYSGRALAGWFTRISVKTSTDVDHVSVYRLADEMCIRDRACGRRFTCSCTREHAPDEQPVHLFRLDGLLRLQPHRSRSAPRNDGYILHLCL